MSDALSPAVAASVRRAAIAAGVRPDGPCGPFGEPTSIIPTRDGGGLSFEQFAGLMRLVEAQASEPPEYVIQPRRGGKRGAVEAEAATLLADGWTEVSDDPAYGPPTPGVRKFNRPNGVHDA